MQYRLETREGEGDPPGVTRGKVREDDEGGLTDSADEVIAAAEGGWGREGAVPAARFTACPTVVPRSKCADCGTAV